MVSQAKIKEILLRFKGGNSIKSKEELTVLKRYASTGMVSFGFNYKTKEGEARLTKQGKWSVKQLN